MSERIIMMLDFNCSGDEGFQEVTARMYSGEESFLMMDELTLSDEMTKFHRRRQPFPLVPVREPYNSGSGAFGMPKFRSYNPVLISMFRWMRDCGVVNMEFDRFRPFRHIIVQVRPSLMPARGTSRGELTTFSLARIRRKISN